MNATITRPNTTATTTFTGGSSLAVGSPSLAALQALVDRLASLPVPGIIGVPNGGSPYHPLPPVAKAPSLRVYSAPAATVAPEAVKTQKPVVKWDWATADAANQTRLAAERETAALKRNRAIGELGLARLDVKISEARLVRAHVLPEVAQDELDVAQIRHLKMVDQENAAYQVIAADCYRSGDLEFRAQALAGVLARVQAACGRLRALEASLQARFVEPAVAEVERELATRTERLRKAEEALKGLEPKSELRTA